MLFARRHDRARQEGGSTDDQHDQAPADGHRGHGRGRRGGGRPDDPGAGLGAQGGDRSGAATGGRGPAGARRRRRGGDRQGHALRGRVRQAQAAGRPGHDPRHGLLDRVDDQARDLDRGHAARRAGQAAARRADRRRAARAEVAAGAGGLRRLGRAAAPSRQAADHAPAPPDPHRRVQLRRLERRHRPLHEGGRDPRRHHGQERRAEDAPGGRPWRALGVRHQHRLGRQGGREGERPVARGLLPRAHLRRSA
jgi:hypothetical protein